MSNEPKVQPYQTQDGSITLYDPELDVLYRSSHGAITESEHVFLHGTGLSSRAGQDWHVLELGFGSAINFTCTARAHAARSAGAQLIYHSVEHRPVSPDALSHLDDWAGAIAREALNQAQQAPTASLISVTDHERRITLHLHRAPWHSLQLQGFHADAIYFDPFGPEKNPDAWTTEAFATAHTHLAEHGILATYSAAGHVRRAMRTAQLYTASLPGPGHKREITIAAKDAALLSHAQRLRAPFPPEHTP